MKSFIDASDQKGARMTPNRKIIASLAFAAACLTVIATAPAVLPGAITAMGTGDDSTYLLIGQEPAGKSLAVETDTTERRLRDVMANFRELDDKQIMVSGTAATEHRFRGSVDQHDWSGVVVLVPRGEKLFTIFGMTRADNDLVQIQENVIARAISSLQFTEQ